jgi:hypothetical protein
MTLDVFIKSIVVKEPTGYQFKFDPIAPQEVEALNGKMVMIPYYKYRMLR